jgi:Putative zinc-finger
MDHDVVVREKMTEKYLLEELDPELRDEFEEHYFDCPDCTRDVRAASQFVEHSRIILASEPVAAPEAANQLQRVSRTGWFAWFRPAFAVPALALLLVVVAYQNLVTLPQMTKSANQPQLLPAATLNLLTYGSNTAPLIIHQGEGFLVNVIIPPGHNYSAYRVDLYNSAGTVEASLPIPPSAEDTWPIRFPGSDRQSGSYKLVVHGITASGQDVEVGSSSFELQIQK